MIARSSGAGLLLVFLVGCVTNLDWYPCDNPDKGHRGPNGEPDPCHYQDADGGTDGGTDGGEDSGAHAEPRCVVGEYAHWSFLWESPTLLWIGPEDQAPECPQGSTTISYEGHDDLVAPAICEACTCEPPTGSCALPSKLTASTAACNISGGSSTSFNAPAPWNGSCDGTTQVPGGAAHSLTIDPLTMTENGCASGPPIAAKIVSLHWETFARGCDVDLPDGPVDRSVCLPDDLLSPGFALCIFRDGEHDCPDDPGTVFTERHIFYQSVQDDRQCSTCTCGAPTGSLCKAQLSIYEGASCSASPLMSNPISSAIPACFDIVLPGQALGSKSVESMIYLPGTCPAMGGDASGNATKTEPSTLCCRP
jgi:hypothetical protein